MLEQVSNKKTCSALKILLLSLVVPNQRLIIERSIIGIYLSCYTLGKKLSLNTVPEDTKVLTLCMPYKNVQDTKPTLNQCCKKLD